MTDITAPPAAAAAGHDDGHAHPTDLVFVKTAGWLALITAAEVAWSYLPLWDDATGLTSFFEISGLLVMMMLKFVIVANIFMHLKYDKPLLSRTFFFGFSLATAVYLATITTFEFWSSGPPGFAP